MAAILARNKELEKARDAAEKRCLEQVRRLEAVIDEVGDNRVRETPSTRRREIAF